MLWRLSYFHPVPSKGLYMRAQFKSILCVTFSSPAVAARHDSSLTNRVIEVGGVVLRYPNWVKTKQRDDRLLLYSYSLYWKAVVRVILITTGFGNLLV